MQSARSATETLEEGTTTAATSSNPQASGKKKTVEVSFSSTSNFVVLFIAMNQVSVLSPRKRTGVNTTENNSEVEEPDELSTKKASRA